MMKHSALYFLLLTASFLLITPSAVSAQTLLEKRFTAPAESEALLDLTASAPGTSWRERDAEAAVVTIYVDSQYHQDVILFAGAREFTYQLLLGRVGPGEHGLRVEFNRKQSAAKAASVKIGDAKVTTIDRKQPEFQAIARAPIITPAPTQSANSATFRSWSIMNPSAPAPFPERATVSPTPSSSATKTVALRRRR